MPSPVFLAGYVFTNSAIKVTEYLAIPVGKTEDKPPFWAYIRVLLPNWGIVPAAVCAKTQFWKSISHWALSVPSFRPVVCRRITKRYLQ